MSREPRPKDEGDALLTPELARTELAPSKDAETRSGPRAIGASAVAVSRAVGRFRIDAPLGSGGMGDVYRAYDPVLDRAVALKVLRSDRSADDQQRMRRMVREARAAAALTHPNTVTIFEVGEADREVFIAMELLEGEDLRAVLERGDARTADKLRWLLEAARALGAAHERGLVHRDVKPENMFVCRGGTLKLLDFGIAKRDDDDSAAPGPAVDMGPSSLRTTEGRRIGTPRYMAPEQHAGDATDPRTDEYAWGLVAFELLAGAHVVADLRTATTDGGDGSPVPALAAQRLDMLRAKAPEVSETVLRTISRALESRKEDRFPSMAPIIAALEAQRDASDDAEPPAPPTPPTPPPPPPAPPEAPPAPPSRMRPWVVLPAIAMVLVAGLVALRTATHSPRGATAGAGVAAAPACHLASSRAVAIGPDDRLAVLPDGAVVLARDIRKGFKLEKETPGGVVPLARNPLTAAIGHDYRDLVLRGVTYEGLPVTFAELDQERRGVFLGLFADTVMVSQRIFGEVSGLTAATFGANIVVVATTSEMAPPRFGGLPSGAEAYLVGHTAGIHRTTIEEGGASSPSVAVSRSRVAVAYDSRGELHFAFLDDGLARIGDVQTVAHTSSRPAVAFAPGDAPAVFWVDDVGGKTRLYVSTFASASTGDPAFSAAKVATDEPLASRAPVTAQLPDGSWVVAWIASTGGLSKLRVSPIGPAGALAGASDVASGERIDGLAVTSTDKGLAFWWHESDSLVRVADVTCGAAFSASMKGP